MLRSLGVLSFALITCAGPSTQVPPDEVQELVVDHALTLAAGCEEINDLTSLAWSWAQVCWHRTAPELDRAQTALEGCRAASIERGLEAVGQIPAGIDLTAPLDFDNCPADPPNDIAQLTVYSETEYAVEDGATITIIFTNFCDEEIDLGFSPDLDSKPPIIMQQLPLTRRTITIPRKYGLRGRLAHADAQWEPSMCTAPRNGTYLTFNADCRTCTSDGIDPLRRADCVEAGSCPAPGSL
jgi:hypothetical protein